MTENEAALTSFPLLCPGVNVLLLVFNKKSKEKREKIFFSLSANM